MARRPRTIQTSSGFSVRLADGREICNRRIWGEAYFKRKRVRVHCPGEPGHKGGHKKQFQREGPHPLELAIPGKLYVPKPRPMHDRDIAQGAGL